MPETVSSAFRQLPYMGVIRVNVEAIEKHGYRMGDPDWSNLGQGQPEVGDMPGAPPRISEMPIRPEDHAYGPIEGIPELREAIAAHYNRFYRKGKKPFSAKNVAVAPGGRAALTRIGATLERSRLGYFTPDYTAYEDLLTTFPRIDPVWLELTPEQGFMMDSDELGHAVRSQNLSTVLISNPCNPTGAVMRGETLAGWAELSRKTGTTLLMDEFYSHFTYDDSNSPASIVEFVDDIETDPIVIVDGLTKSFRYPGWRLGWVIASERIINTLAAAGSFLDGGPCRPIQRAAILALEPSQADQETQAVRNVFRKKRDLTISGLTEMGIEFPHKPMGTFYAFGYVGNLPSPYNTGEGFMREAFKVQVLTVPGEYFDVNPNRARKGTSALTSWVRFSFGPPTTNLEAGLNRLAGML
jgi:aspartate/methionine/tyrosine aminotransferase